MGPAVVTSSSTTLSGYYPRLVAGTRVLFDTVPSAILYASADKVVTVVPYFEYWRDTAQVQVEYQGSQSVPVPVPIVGAVPGLFNASSVGSLGFGAVLNQDGTANSASNPSYPGSLVSVFGTGEGQTNPAGVDTRVTSNEFPVPRLPLNATVNGVAAQVQSANEAPGLVSGVLLINVVVPAGVSGGASIPIQISVDGRPANVVDCAVQVFTLTSSSANVDSGGGSGSVSLNAAIAGVGSWSAKSNASWIMITSSPSGSGSGTIEYSVSQNPSSTPRSGTLTIGGQTFTLKQTAMLTPCDISGAAASVTDVQHMISEALGMMPPVNDLIGDGRLSVADVQIIVNAVLGLGCAAN